VLFPDGPGTLNKGDNMAQTQAALTILRRPHVQAETGYSRSTIYLRVQQGLLPRPVRLGARAVGWPASEVAAINAARIAGRSDDEIRALVTDLEATRTGLGGAS
jgi:prophage regulatory protein